MMTNAMLLRAETLGVSGPANVLLGLFVLFVLLAVCLVPSFASAQAERPRIGLVLSGGGAKGAAHVGVIKVLEEMNVHVDLVVGTSMGSIVGGLYASGLGSQELEEAIEGIDWTDIFNDDPPRAERSFRRKQDDSDVLIRYRLGVKDGKVRLPSGIIIGQKLGLALRRLAAHTPEQSDFDQFPRAFRAVAADLEAGEPVIMASGSLARAMHASMSVPGVFPPVELDGRLLVDGGVVNNLPIDVARAMGAERLIVVDVQSEPPTREMLSNAVQIAEQAVNVMILRETRRQLATLEPDDILIQPALGDILSTDFLRSREAVNIGEVAARENSTRLAMLARGPRATTSVGRAVPRKARTIASIRIENDTPLDDAVLAAKLTLRPGDELDHDRLERDLSRIYGLGYFETVDYRLEDREDGSHLVIDARERRIGLNSLRFGLTLESDFSGTSQFNFITAYEALGVNSLGAEWRSAFAFGQNVFIGTEFHQPLDVRQRWFVEPSAAYLESDVGVFDGRRRVAQYRVERTSFDFDVGYNPANCCELRAGVRFGVGEARLETGARSLPGGSFQIGQFVASAGYDTIDNSRFPRDGAALQVGFEHGFEALGSNDESRRLDVGAAIARSVQDHTFLASLQVGADLGGNDDVEDLFSVGGLFNLSGFARNELSGQNSARAALLYYYRMTRIGDVDVGVPLYLGGSIEYGGVYDSLSDVGGDNDIAAGALFIGADTPLGPFYLGYGSAEGGRRSLYLFLGQTF